MHITIGRGGYVPVENWRMWMPSRAGPNLPLVVGCHGGGGEERFMDRDWHAGLHDTMVDVCERVGCALMVPDHTTAQEPTGAHTWGNDDSTTAIAAAIAWARASWGVGPQPVVMWGGSMGHVTAWSYARRFPADVAAVIGVAGAASLDYHHQGNDAAVGWHQTEIDAAWDAADYTTVIKPAADPMVMAPSLGIPWQGWWGDADPVARLVEAQAFEPLVDGTLHVVPGGDHTTTFDGIDAEVMASFIESVL